MHVGINDVCVLEECGLTLPSILRFRYRVRKIEMSKPDGSDLAFGMADHSAVAEPEADEQSAKAVTRRSDGALSFIFRAPGQEDAQTQTENPSQTRTKELAAIKRKVDSLESEAQASSQKRCRVSAGNATGQIPEEERRKIVQEVRALLLSSGVAESGDAPDSFIGRGDSGMDVAAKPDQAPDSIKSLSKTARKKQAKAKARAAQKASHAAARQEFQSREDALATALSRSLCSVDGAVVEPPNCHICYTHCNSVRELARHALGKKHRRRAEVEVLWDAFRRQKERELCVSEK